MAEEVQNGTGEPGDDIEFDLAPGAVVPMRPDLHTTAAAGRPQGLEAALRAAALPPSQPPGNRSINPRKPTERRLGEVLRERLKQPAASQVDRGGTQKGKHFQAPSREPGSTVTSAFAAIEDTRPPPGETIEQAQPASPPPSKPSRAAGVLGRISLVRRLFSGGDEES